jgi:hypothetical protein
MTSSLSLQHWQTRYSGVAFDNTGNVVLPVTGLGWDLIATGGFL